MGGGGYHNGEQEISECHDIRSVAIVHVLRDCSGGPKRGLFDGSGDGCR